jgi:hypothetical protein
VSKLPLNIAALEAERTRATKAFRRQSRQLAIDTPADVHRRRRLLFDATRHLEHPYGGDAA